MRKFKGKEVINTLLHIGNVFGEYEGKVMPVILTILLVAFPFLVWMILSQIYDINIIPVVLFDIPWGIFWGLEIMLDGKSQRKFYKEQLEDKGATADDIIHIKSVSEDGLIQYDNGKVVYLLSGYLRSYLTDDKLSVDLENFMDELDAWNWDYYLHNSMDELLCEDRLPSLKDYTDKQVIRERIDFYEYQDEWSRSNTSLYRITFAVSAPAYDYKKLQVHLRSLIQSDLATCFNEIEIMNYDGVADVCSRDICAHIAIRQMLLRKFDNDEFYQSKVMWYDDNVPEEMKPKVEESRLDKRRQ